PCFSRLTGGTFFSSTHLSVFPVKIPPLRDRREDIPALAHHFVSLFRSRLNRPDVRFTNDDAELLKRYDWPGNVRELQNVIERAMILVKKGQLRLDLALAYYRPAESPSTEIPLALRSKSSNGKILRSEDLKHLERDSIVAALERSNRKIYGPGGGVELLGLN